MDVCKLLTAKADSDTKSHLETMRCITLAAAAATNPSVGLSRARRARWCGTRAMTTRFSGIPGGAWRRSHPRWKGSRIHSMEAATGPHSPREVLAMADSSLTDLRNMDTGTYCNIHGVPRTLRTGARRVIHHMVFRYSPRRPPRGEAVVATSGHVITHKSFV